MAHDPGPCGPQFEDWEAAYAKWQAKNSAANSAMRRAAAATAVAAGICGGTWWTGVGLVGCAGATATALYFDGESINASLERNAASSDLGASKRNYENCTKQHKHYYGP